MHRYILKINLSFYTQENQTSGKIPFVKSIDFGYIDLVSFLMIEEVALLVEKCTVLVLVKSTTQNPFIMKGISQFNFQRWFKMMMTKAIIKAFLFLHQSESFI